MTESLGKMDFIPSRKAFNIKSRGMSSIGVFQNYSFYLNKQNNTTNGMRKYYMCTVRFCKARLVTDVEGNVLKQGGPEHTHMADPIELETRRTIADMKHRALTTSLPAGAIVAEAFSEGSPSNRRGMVLHPSFARAMQRVRRSAVRLQPNPETKEELILMDPHERLDDNGHQRREILPLSNSYDEYWDLPRIPMLCASNHASTANVGNDNPDSGLSTNGANLDMPDSCVWEGLGNIQSASTSWGGEREVQNIIKDFVICKQELIDSDVTTAPPKESNKRKGVDSETVHYRACNQNVTMEEHQTSETPQSDAEKNEATPTGSTANDRKFLIVDENRLVQLFKRCPNCGNIVKYAHLSQRDTTPKFVWECTGDCGISEWTAL